MDPLRPAGSDGESRLMTQDDLFEQKMMKLADIAERYKGTMKALSGPARLHEEIDIGLAELEAGLATPLDVEALIAQARCEQDGT